MTAGVLAVLLALLVPAEGAPGNRPFRAPGVPVLVAPAFEELAPLSQYPVPALTGAQMMRLSYAQALRQNGQLEAARDSVQALLQRAPHHPLLVAELARIESARSDWAAVERLGRAERASQHDSLLVGPELATALEHLKRPHEAAQIAIECWIVRPADGDWAYTTIARLANADAKGVREVLHRAVVARPERLELQSGEARLAWKLGDGDAAMKELSAADRPGLTPPLHWRFAEELLHTTAARDSAGAIDALIAMAADTRFETSHRVLAAKRAMDVARARGSARSVTPDVAHALADVPPARWNADLLVDVARGLREAGKTGAARQLLDTPDVQGPARDRLTLERALGELREGPPVKALGSFEAIHDTSADVRFHYAEALFFAGMPDSALATYKRVSNDPQGSFTGAAFERMFLIEDAEPKSALPAVGRIMYLDWRGDAAEALAAADSLRQTLPPNALWAQLSLFVSAHRDAGGQAQDAIAPLLEVAEKLPNDRLAPVALERAGDLYADKLKDDPHAIAQYEACLTRYPKAWNSAEVRRRLEQIRKGSRF